MQFHTLQSTNKLKKKKRIGRGGKRGTYSGKGLKGQKARAGRKLRPELRDIIKKIPKKRGYRFSSPNKKPLTITLASIGRVFATGEIVTPKTLLEKQLLKKKDFKTFSIKIVGKDAVSKKISVQGCLITKGAKETIEKGGGSVSVLK